MGLARALNVEDLREIARRRLPRLVFDYVEGGAEEGASLKRNRAAFDAIRFAPRTLVDTSQRSQRVSILGRMFESPIGIAPMAAAGLLWHEGDLALARAARAAGVPFVLSSQALMPLSRLTADGGGAPWFQLYMPRDRAATRKLLARALQCDCQICVLTTDVPVPGNREYNERNGFGSKSPWRAAGKIVDGLAHPRWLFGVYARRGGLLRQDMAPSKGSDARRDHTSWRDLAWLRDAWPRKLLVKGILNAEDAVLAAEHGADGIFVSNHGGRQLDGVPSPLEVLPQIAAAVGEKLMVAVDSGFRRGTDIVKAIALGADIVFVGRAAAYGLAAGGEAGVRRALQLLRAEIDRVLALLGCPSIELLGPQFLHSENRRAEVVSITPPPQLRVA